MDGSLAEYELLDELGRGGMGRVLRARHRPTGTVRAVKLLDDLSDPELFLRFQREAEALARVGGAGIVPIHGLGLDRGRPWLAMPLLPGGSLAERIKARPRWPWEEAVRLVLALCEPLARCHQAGIIHRDLKPENVLFDDQDRPCLADFGAARDVTQPGLTRTGTFVGTPLTMAPEQMEGQPVDARADIYALGVILQLLIAGAPPFEGTSLMRMLAAKQAGRRAQLLDVPAALEEALQRVLDPDPQNRPGRAEELAAALRHALESPRPARRRGALPAALLLAGLALGGAGLVLRDRAVPAPAAQPPRPAPPGTDLPTAHDADTSPPTTSDAAELLERARLTLVTDFPRSVELIEELERRVEQGAVLPEAERRAFLAASDDRSAAAWRETHDGLDQERYRRAITPWLLARRVASWPPRLTQAVPPELVEASKRLRLAVTVPEEGPLRDLAETACLYLPADPEGLGLALASGLRRSAGRVPYQPSMEILGAVIGALPEHPWPLVARAELELLIGKRPIAARDEAAQADLVRALALIEEQPANRLELECQARIDLAALLERRGEGAAALEQCQAVVTRQGRHSNMLSARLHGYLLMKARRYADARQVLADAAEVVSPSSAPTLRAWAGRIDELVDNERGLTTLTRNIRPARVLDVE